jgi:hypothetical protein
MTVEPWRPTPSKELGELLRNDYPSGLAAPNSKIIGPYDPMRSAA